jgi:hypothetical protein
MNRLEELSENVKRILSYLENDETTGRKGIFHDVSDLKDRVGKIEDRHKLQVGLIAVFSSIGAGLIWLFEHIFIKK